MLTKHRTRPDHEAEEIFAGQCGTCKAILEVEYWQAVHPATAVPVDKESAVAFGNLPYAECQQCKANSKLKEPVGTRVYLMPKAEFLRVIGKLG